MCPINYEQVGKNLKNGKKEKKEKKKKRKKACFICLFCQESVECKSKTINANKKQTSFIVKRFKKLNWNFFHIGTPLL